MGIYSIFFGKINSEYFQRLFDNMKDSDTSGSSMVSSRSQPSSAKRVAKSAARSGDSVVRMSCRIKALRAEDKRNKKSSISPRRRHVNMSQKQRLQYIGRKYVRQGGNSSSMDVSQVSTDKYALLYSICFEVNNI